MSDSNPFAHTGSASRSNSPEAGTAQGAEAGAAFAEESEPEGEEGVADAADEAGAEQAGENGAPQYARPPHATPTPKGLNIGGGAAKKHRPGSGAVNSTQVFRNTATCMSCCTSMQSCLCKVCDNVHTVPHVHAHAQCSHVCVLV